MSLFNFGFGIQRRPLQVTYSICMVWFWLAWDTHMVILYYEHTLNHSKDTCIGYFMHLHTL